MSAVTVTRLDTRAIKTALIQGSKAIDHMREEIDSFVNMLLGLLKRDDFFGVDSGGFYRFAEFDLKKLHCKGFLIDGEGNVEVWVEGRPDPLFSVREGIGAQGVPLELVQDVYEGLPILLGQAIDTFPKLMQRFQPLLRAAGATELLS